MFGDRHLKWANIPLCAWCLMTGKKFNYQSGCRGRRDGLVLRNQNQERTAQKQMLTMAIFLSEKASRLSLKIIQLRWVFRTYRFIFNLVIKTYMNNLVVSTAVVAKLFNWVHSSPGGFTLHMTGYAPACTKSVEKGSFLDIRRRRRLLQKGYIFRC